MVEILSIGKSLELIKDLGDAKTVCDRYELNKVKGGTTLNPEEHITQASINTEKKVSSDSSEDISSQLKSLKELLDSGAITQEEFNKGKKKILN